MSRASWKKGYLYWHVLAGKESYQSVFFALPPEPPPFPIEVRQWITRADRDVTQPSPSTFFWLPPEPPVPEEIRNWITRWRTASSNFQTFVGWLTPLDIPLLPEGEQRLTRADKDTQQLPTPSVFWSLPPEVAAVDVPEEIRQWITRADSQPELDTHLRTFVSWQRAVEQEPPEGQFVVIRADRAVSLDILKHQGLTWALPPEVQPLPEGETWLTRADRDLSLDAHFRTFTSSQRAVEQELPEGDTWITRGDRDASLDAQIQQLLFWLPPEAVVNEVPEEIRSWITRWRVPSRNFQSFTSWFTPLDVTQPLPEGVQHFTRADRDVRQPSPSIFIWIPPVLVPGVPEEYNVWITRWEEAPGDYETVFGWLTPIDLPPAGVATPIFTRADAIRSLEPTQYRQHFFWLPPEDTPTAEGLGVITQADRLVAFDPIHYQSIMFYPSILIEPPAEVEIRKMISMGFKDRLIDKRGSVRLGREKWRQ